MKTLLTKDFLTNEMAFDSGMNASLETAKFNDYYYAVCDYIREVFYLEPTNEEIEQIIETGVLDTFVCPITDQSERQYVFKRAMAKQFIFDMVNGRGAMMRDDLQGFNICLDTQSAIKSLGLYQRTFAVV